MKQTGRVSVSVGDNYQHRCSLEKTDRQRLWRSCRGRLPEEGMRSSGHTARMHDPQRTVSSRSVTAASHGSAITHTTLILPPILRDIFEQQLGSDMDGLLARFEQHRAGFSCFLDILSWEDFVVGQLCREVAERQVAVRHQPPLPGLMASAEVSQEHTRLLALYSKHTLSPPAHPVKVLTELGVWNLLDNLSNEELTAKQAFNLLLDMAIRAGMQPERLLQLLCFCDTLQRTTELSEEQNAQMIALKQELDELACGRSLLESFMAGKSDRDGMLLSVREHRQALYNYCSYLKGVFLFSENPLSDPDVQEKAKGIMALLQGLAASTANSDQALQEFVQYWSSRNKQISGFFICENIGSLSQVFYPEIQRYACKKDEIILIKLFDLIKDLLLIASGRNLPPTEISSLSFLHGTSTDALLSIGNSAGLVVPSGYLLKHSRIPLAGEMEVALRTTLNREALSGAGLDTEEMSMKYATDLLDAADRQVLLNRIHQLMQNDFETADDIKDFVDCEQTVLFRCIDDCYSSVGRAQAIAVSLGRLKQVAPQDAKALEPKLTELLELYDRSLAFIRGTSRYQAAVYSVGSERDVAKFRDGYAKEKLLSLEYEIDTLRKVLSIPALEQPVRDEQPRGIVLGSCTLPDETSLKNVHERMLRRPGLLGRDFQFVFCQSKDKEKVIKLIKDMGPRAGNIQVRDLAHLKRAARLVKRNRPKLIAEIGERIKAGRL